MNEVHLDFSDLICFELYKINKSITEDEFNNVIFYLDSIIDCKSLSPKVFDIVALELLTYLSKSKKARNPNSHQVSIIVACLKRLFSIGKYIIAIDKIYIEKYIPYIFCLALYKEKFSISISDIERSLDSIVRYPFDTWMINKWFLEFFIIYENPSVLTSQFHKLNGNELGFLMGVLAGDKLKDINILSERISKKELYIIVNCLDDRFNFNSDILVRSIYLSRIIMYSPNQMHIIQYFIERLSLFNQDIEAFKEQLLFWKNVYVFFCNNRVRRAEIVDFIDFFEHKMRETDGQYNLKAKTYSSVKNAISAWHISLAEKAINEKSKIEWGEVKDGVKLSYKDQDYLVEEITNGKDLHNEGMEMHHCVYSYLNNCVKGRTRIFSLKSVVSGACNRLLTIEVVKSKVVQVKGRYNRMATMTENIILSKWKREMRFN